MLTPPLSPLFCRLYLELSEIIPNHWKLNCIWVVSKVEDPLHRGCRRCRRTRRSSRGTRWYRNVWGTTSRVVVDLIHLLHPAFIAPVTWLSTDLTVVVGDVALAFALALHRVIVITLAFAFVILATFRVPFRLSKLALLVVVGECSFLCLCFPYHPSGCCCGAIDPLCLCLWGVFLLFHSKPHPLP